MTPRQKCEKIDRLFLQKMKSGIHPKTGKMTAVCSCGAVHEIDNSTIIGELRVEICAACHPHYTGQQKIVDTAGRVDKFKKKWEAAAKKAKK